MRKRYYYWLLPLTWMGIIFYSSAQPYEKQDIKPMLLETVNLSFLEPFLGWVDFEYNHSEVSVNTLGTIGVIEFFIRKGAHFVAFFVLLLLFYLAFRATVNWSFKRIVAVSISLTIAYAIIDELHQGLTPNRTPYIGDIFIDGFGATTACMFLLFFRIKKRSNRKVRKF